MTEQVTPVTRRSARRLIVGLAIGVCVVVAALIVWLVVRPATGVPNGKVSSVGSRVPDLSAPPTGWSAPVALDMVADASYQVIDTGVGATAAIESGQNLQAVDLSSMTVLWSLKDGSYWATLDDGTAVVSDGSNVFFNVDMRTGKMTRIGAIPAGEQVIVTDGHEVISATYGMDPGGFRHYCARLLGGSSQCQWQAIGGNMDVSLDLFGGGHWISAGGDVYDVTTGALASFGVANGQDTSTYYFTGPAGGVVRISSVSDSDGVVKTYVQAWDTDHDVGVGTPTLMVGAEVWSSFGSPLLLSYDDQQQVLAAYSWTTAQELWRVPLHPGYGTPTFRVFDGMTEVITDQPSASGRPQTQVLDNATGAVLWQGDQYSVIAAGQSVVYMAQCDDTGCGAALDAFDTGFNQLWSMAGPVASVEFDALAGHVVAVSQATGQLWALQAG